MYTFQSLDGTYHFDVLANDGKFIATQLDSPTFNAAGLEAWQKLLDCV